MLRNERRRYEEEEGGEARPDPFHPKAKKPTSVGFLGPGGPGEKNLELRLVIEPERGQAAALLVKDAERHVSTVPA